MASNGFWEDVSAEAAKSAKKFTRSITLPDFDPSQRRLFLREALPQIQPYDARDSDVIKRNLATQVQGILSKGIDIVVGIPKKGMALLREINRILGIPDAQIVEGEGLDSLELGGKRILVVDDSVHRGKTLTSIVEKLLVKGVAKIDVATVFTTEEGKNEVQKIDPRVKVFSQLTISDATFGVYYQLTVTPVLMTLRGGTISNRPHVQFEVSAPKFDPRVWARDALLAIDSLPLASEVFELPPLDGASWPVFRGTIEISNEERERVQSSMVGVADIDQAKLRFYVSATEAPLSLYVYAIVWPIGLPGQTAKDVKAAVKDASRDLLERAALQLGEAFNAKGYTLRKVAIRP